jgi:hypothetical protein
VVYDLFVKRVKPWVGCYGYSLACHLYNGIYTWASAGGAAAFFLSVKNIIEAKVLILLQTMGHLHGSSFQPDVEYRADNSKSLDGRVQTAR